MSLFEYIMHIYANMIIQNCCKHGDLNKKKINKLTVVKKQADKILSRVSP